MFVSAVTYIGLVVAIVGAALVIKPAPRLHVSTRPRATALSMLGVALAILAIAAPAGESRVGGRVTRLDEFMPVWQFSERHSLRVEASPGAVYEAMKSVRANEIFLFRALTWIRRGGRPLPESILNAGDSAPLIDVALRSGFVLLAEQPPREFVMGTVVRPPAGARDTLGPQLFKTPPAGYAVAAMNFVVRPSGPNASMVTTETRVFANGAQARRRFAIYWRLIYPGSALIRRMWLRAIAKRAARSH